MLMKRLLLLVPILVVAACNDRDKTDVEMNAGVAFASAREALGTAWDSMSREASKITADSSKQALQEAQKQAEAMQAQLSKIEIKNPLSEAQMTAAKEQLTKIQAAMQVQNLREQSEAAVQKAIESGQVAQQKYEDASKQLAQLDSNYRDLRNRLDSAQSTYDQAASALSGALEKVKSLAGTK